MRAKEFILLEYRRDVTAQNWGKKLLDRADKDRSFVSYFTQNVQPGHELGDSSSIEFILASLEKADPTPHKEYVQWLAKQFVAGTKFEDIISRGPTALARFAEMKKRRQLSGQQADINRLTFSQVEDIAAAYKPKEPEAEKGRGQAKLYYEDAQMRIIIPQDQEAACYYGQGTKWCTAATNNNMFASYSQSSPLYIILPKQPSYTGQKYQFSFSAKQFMNEQDVSIKLPELMIRFPQLHKVFEEQAREYGILSILLSPEELRKKYAEFNEQVGLAAKKVIKGYRDSADPSRSVGALTRNLVNLVPLTNNEINAIRYHVNDTFTDANGLMDVISKVLTKLFPDDINNDDAIWEESFDTLSEWFNSTELAELLEEIFMNNDDAYAEEAIMDAHHEVIGVVAQMTQMVGDMVAKAIAVGTER